MFNKLGAEQGVSLTKAKASLCFGCLFLFSLLCFLVVSKLGLRFRPCFGLNALMRNSNKPWQRQPPSASPTEQPRWRWRSRHRRRPRLWGPRLWGNSFANFEERSGCLEESNAGAWWQRLKDRECLKKRVCKVTLPMVVLTDSSPFHFLESVLGAFLAGLKISHSGSPYQSRIFGRGKEAGNMPFAEIHWRRSLVLMYNTREQRCTLGPERTGAESKQVRSVRTNCKVRYNCFNVKSTHFARRVNRINESSSHLNDNPERTLYFGSNK